MCAINHTAVSRGLAAGSRTRRDTGASCQAKDRATLQNKTTKQALNRFRSWTKLSFNLSANHFAPQASWQDFPVITSCY